MKCWLSSIIVLISATTFSQEIKKGEVIPVHSNTLIVVANKGGIRHGNNFFIKGEHAFLREGGRVKVIKIEENKVLLKYYISGRQSGCSALSQTRFYLEKDEYIKFKYDRPALETN